MLRPRQWFNRRGMSRPRGTERATRRVLSALEHHGLLLQAGSEFPSVANIVAGEPIRGSWWAHPKANLIYWVCQDLDADARVTEARLLGGKVTHVWHTIWPEVTAVAMARDAWQTRGIDRHARGLVERVDGADVRTDGLRWRGARKLGDVCRLLERRLLVKAVEIHTESGRHAKVLTSWPRWWAAHGGGPLPAGSTARVRLESRVDDLRLLPWSARRAHPR